VSTVTAPCDNALLPVIVCESAGIVWLWAEWVMSVVGSPVSSAVATVAEVSVPVPIIVAVRVCWWAPASLIVVFPVSPALWLAIVIAESTAEPLCEPTVTLSVAAPPVIVPHRRPLSQKSTARGNIQGRATVRL